MFSSPWRQIKRLKRPPTQVLITYRQILISASPRKTHRSEIRCKFSRGNPRSFIEKDRKYWNRWFVFPCHDANGRLKSKNKCGIPHFQKDLDEVTFTLTAPAKAVFLLACGLCLLLIIPVIIPKKTCHFCHVNLFTCSLLL